MLSDDAIFTARERIALNPGCGPVNPIYHNGAPLFEGLTLRDFLACKAMTSFIEGYGRIESADWIAVRSYRMADEMLAARQRTDSDSPDDSE